MPATLPQSFASATGPASCSRPSLAPARRPRALTLASAPFSAAPKACVHVSARLVVVHVAAGPAFEPVSTSYATPQPPALDAAELEAWLAFARDVDARSAAVAASKARLERSVILEDYEAAARAKAELAALQRADCLGEIVRRQADAVARDDFAAAAALRDASQQSLTGWWAATNTGSDPWSHVIRVTEGYSRLEARAYSPAHLADVMGWDKESPYHRAVGNRTYDDVGVPFFEVLLRRSESGELQRRHFVLPDGLSADEQLGHSIVGFASYGAPAEPTPPAAAAPAAAKAPSSIWDLLMNRKAAVAKARRDGVTLEAPAPVKPAPGADATNMCAQNNVKGQLAPRRADETPPSLREAFEKLEELDALAAISELEERTAMSLGAGASTSAPPERSRAACHVDLVDRNHLRVTLPALKAGGAPRTIDYTRLEHEASTSDPLTGYYLGSFGVHGPEVLLLQRGLWDGEEAVIAHKVTGDPNVPAGQVSFRAKVGARHRLSVAAYPSALCVTQRYSGQGCVAEHGFLKSRWAEGELLAFGGARGGKFRRVTGNSELGFIWSIAHSKRFLILLSRVHFTMPPKAV